MDTGDVVVAARSRAIGADETYGELHDRLAQLGAEPAGARPSSRPRRRAARRAAERRGELTRPIERDDLLIDWGWPAAADRAHGARVFAAARRARGDRRRKRQDFCARTSTTTGRLVIDELIAPNRGTNERRRLSAEPARWSRARARVARRARRLLRGFGGTRRAPRTPRSIIGVRRAALTRATSPSRPSWRTARSRCAARSTWYLTRVASKTMPAVDPRDTAVGGLRTRLHAGRRVRDGLRVRQPWRNVSAIAGSRISSTRCCGVFCAIVPPRRNASVRKRRRVRRRRASRCRRGSCASGTASSEHALEEICAAVNEPAKSAIVVNALRGNADEAAAALLAARCRDRPVADRRRSAAGRARDAWASWATTRRWWPQSESSAMPVDVLNPQPGEAILDVCSGRGNKALQIGARLATGRHAVLHRARRAQSRAPRTAARTGAGHRGDRHRRCNAGAAAARPSFRTGAHRRSMLGHRHRRAPAGGALEEAAAPTANAWRPRSGRCSSRSRVTFVPAAR